MFTWHAWKDEESITAARAATAGSYTYGIGTCFQTTLKLFLQKKIPELKVKMEKRDNNVL